MNQPSSTAITFRPKLEMTAAPASEWRHAAEAYDREVLGVVAISGDGNLPLEERWRVFEASKAGVEEAIALWRASSKAGNGWQPKVRLAVGADTAAIPHTWVWTYQRRENIVPFDTGVCLERQCISYSDMRAVGVGALGSQWTTFAASQAGVLSALRDSIMSDGNSRIAIEMRTPASPTARELVLYDVSVLEDDRICGLASEFPLPATERCFGYGEIAGGFEVQDQRSSFGDALVDTVVFPFRLVGAAASSAGIGGN